MSQRQYLENRLKLAFLAGYRAKELIGDEDGRPDEEMIYRIKALYRE